MIILHSEHSAESRAFVQSYKEGNTVINWYDDQSAQLQYELSGNPQPSAFPFVVYQGKGFVNPESPQWVKDEVNGVHLTEQDYVDALTVVRKLTLRRAMRELGCENELDTILANNPGFDKDWNDAHEIDLTAPMVLEAMALMNIDVEAIKLAIVRAEAAGKALHQEEEVTP